VQPSSLHLPSEKSFNTDKYSMLEIDALSNSESSKGGDPDLKYSTGVLHCFSQEQSKKLIALEIHKDEL